MTTAVFGMSLFMLVQLLVTLHVRSWAVSLWIAYGFFGTTGIISYAGLSQCFPQNTTGRVTTSINLLVFIAAFGTQWAIGAIINRWPVAADGSYAPAGYQAGFALMLGLQFLSLLWFLFFRPQKEPS